MKLQKIGGVASIANAVLLIILLVIVIIVSPRLGLLELADWLDPVKYSDAMVISPIPFYIINLGMILSAIAYFLFVLALRERMQTNAPNLMRSVVIAVSITCTLWLVYGLIGIMGIPSIVNAKDVSAFRAVIAINTAIGTAGDSAAGWVLLLIGVAALKTRELPKILCYFSILKGIFMIIEFLALPFTLIGMLLGIVVYPWLGIALLRIKK